MVALKLFLVCRRDDLAEKLIVHRRTDLSGKDWHVLLAIAGQLQHEAPLAATILYRAEPDRLLVAVVAFAGQDSTTSALNRSGLEGA